VEEDDAREEETSERKREAAGQHGKASMRRPRWQRGAGGVVEAQRWAASCGGEPSTKAVLSEEDEDAGLVGNYPSVFFTK
jgi:hypothetical protein